jgi:putative transposase
VIPRIAHHVVQRGVRRMDVFHSDEDRKLYLKLLQQARDQTRCEFLAWCLMSNHVHFLVIPPAKDSLAELFRWTHTHYTRYKNRLSECSGHLWQARFHSSPLSPSHLARSLRYILLNPVKAGLVEKSIHYEWSSARFTFNPKLGDPLIRQPINTELRSALKSLGMKKLNEDATNIDSCLRGNRPYADANTISKWEKTYQIALTPQKRGRRPLIGDGD